MSYRARCAGKRLRRELRKLRRKPGLTLHTVGQVLKVQYGTAWWIRHSVKRRWITYNQAIEAAKMPENREDRLAKIFYQDRPLFQLLPRHPL